MPTKLFSATPGSVALVSPVNEKGSVSPFSLQIESEPWNYSNIQGILTSASMSHETNSQFVQTLSDDIYITVFGTKPGAMSIGGILFLNEPGVCGVGVTSSAKPLEAFYTKFLESCVTSRKRHLVVTLGTVTVKAFLVAFQLNIMDPQTSFGNFTMQFVLLPRKK